MKKLPIILYFILQFLLFGCKTSNSKTGEAIELFNIKPLIEKDITYNQAKKKKKKKVITVNQKQETTNVSKIDWAKELQIVLNADINKKDWEDKFTKQTTFDSLENIETTKYLSFNSKVPIKKFIVKKSISSDTIHEIYIEKIIQSGLFSNDQIITYRPTAYLKVASVQKAIFMDDFISEVEIYFIR